MKPAWDQLGDEFAGSSSVLIGDADCTAEGKSLCDKHGVEGFPTIKYFTDGDTTEGKSYDGGRDYDALKTHTSLVLEVKCLIADPAGSGCNEKQVGYIEKMKVKTSDERTAQSKRLYGMKGQTMAPANKQWLMQRVAILRQFDESKDEL